MKVKVNDLNIKVYGLTDALLFTKLSLNELDCNLQPNQDTEFGCALCEKPFSHELLQHNHLQRFHKIDPLKNPNKLLPDINNPDVYCRSCKKKYSTKSKYYIHLRMVHNMENPDGRRYIKYPHIASSRYDPNNYCSAYEDQHSFYYHFRQIHKINIFIIHRRIFKNNQIKPGVNNPNISYGTSNDCC